MMTRFSVLQVRWTMPLSSASLPLAKILPWTAPLCHRRANFPLFSPERRLGKQHVRLISSARRHVRVVGSMEGQGEPVVKDLVLLGGGHSHVYVLKNFGMKPMPGVRITLITRDVHTPYSGMLPGYIAGHYTYDDCHVDLRPLARFCNARLLHCVADGIDVEKRQVTLRGRPPVPFDVLSIDIGITPSTFVHGSQEFTTGVKPIDLFSEKFERLRSRVISSPHKMTILVVGGGAGGVELCLAMQYRLQLELEKAGKKETGIRFCLVSRGKLLRSHARKVGGIFERVLKERGVEVIYGAVQRVEAGLLVLEDGKQEAFDECVWCTQGGAAKWLGATGLSLDKDGFISVEDSLQCINQTGIFACGDIHSSIKHPRPKAGVFAVRQGPPLTENLRRTLSGQSLKPFKPQTNFLGLISTGDKYAVLSRGSFAFEASWLWNLKDWIDTKWMSGYRFLPEMRSPPRPPPPVAVAAGQGVVAELAGARMRCGGCGSKVGSSVLSRALKRLEISTRPEVVLGVESKDDAAVVRLPPGALAVHTVDFFKSIIDDVYTFGAIAANHALGDCYAMGAEPISALALACVPFGLEKKVEEDLYQMMAGALSVLKEANCSLVGGHTSESSELGLGFAINGAVEEALLLRKAGMQPSDCLILTKALGTGVLFAADMKGKAKGCWIDGAVESMLMSAGPASKILREFGAKSCTDVTGFGLIGHLAEMVEASGVEVCLAMGSIPLLDGALECSSSGIASSLLPSNIRLSNLVSNSDDVSRNPLFPLLFDPQTAGGLLAPVPEQSASACLRALQEAGYKHASVIGKVIDKKRCEKPIVITETLQATPLA